MILPLLLYELVVAEILAAEVTPFSILVFIDEPLARSVWVTVKSRSKSFLRVPYAAIINEISIPFSLDAGVA